MEARMIKAGRREYVQVLRLLESFGMEDLHVAVKNVNAGVKMHRRAGVKMHQGGRRAGHSEHRFPVRLMSLLSRPDLGTGGRGAQRRGWEERSHAQQREHGEHRTFPVVSTVAG
jgi:hypothetical protein